MNNQINRANKNLLFNNRNVIADVRFRQVGSKTSQLPKKAMTIPVSRLAPSRLDELYMPNSLNKQVLEFVWPEVKGSSFQPEQYMSAMFKLSKRAPEFLKDKQLEPLGKLLLEEREMQMLLYGYRNQVVMV